MTTLLDLNFDSGTLGGSPANAAAVGLDDYGSSITWENSHTGRGLCLRDYNSTIDTAYFRKDITSSTVVYLSYLTRLTNLVTGNMLQVGTTGGTIVGGVRVRSTDGKFLLRNGTSDSTVGTTTYTADSWIKLQAKFDTVAGTSSVRIFTSPDDTVPAETITGTIGTGTAITRVEFGFMSNITGYVYVDDLWTSDTSYAPATSGGSPAAVGVDVTNDPLGGVRTFTDVTDYIRGPVVITRGRQDERGDLLQPATCTFTLNNDDKRFTPGYSGGPYGSNFRKGAGIRIQVDHDGTTYDRFTGYIDRIDGPSWPGGVTQTSRVTVTCVDEVGRWAKGRRLKSLVYETLMRDNPVAYYQFTQDNRGRESDLSDTEQTTLEERQAGGGGAIIRYSVTTSDGRTVSIHSGSSTRGVRPVYDGRTRTSDDGRNWPSGSMLFITGDQGGFNYYTGALSVTASTKWAVGCWVRLPRTDSTNGSFFWNLINGTRYWSVGCNADGRVRVVQNDSSAETVSEDTRRVANGDWHYLLCHYTQGGNTTLYMDGQLILTATSKNWDNGTTGPTLEVGRGNLDATTPRGIKYGRLAHLAVYNGTAADDAVTHVDDHYQAGWSGFNGAHTGDMFERCVGWLQYPYATDIEQGLSIVGDEGFSGATGMEYAQLLLASETGTCFTKGDGTLVFHGRDYRYENTTASLTIDWHHVGTSWTTSDEFMVNRATYVTYDGTEARSINQTSVDDYGPYPVEVQTLLRSQQEAESLAKFAIYRRGTPTPRLSQLPVDLLTEPDPAQVTAALETWIDDRISLTSLPSQSHASTATAFVEGWTEVIGTPDAGVWQIVFNTSPTYTFAEALNWDIDQWDQEKWSY